jgi:hypothetical protein
LKLFNQTGVCSFCRSDVDESENVGRSYVNAIKSGEFEEAKQYD